MKTSAHLLTGGWMFPAFLLATATLALGGGCGGGGDGTHTVSGKITFKAAPVTEGRITFEDPASGFASSGELDSNGAYRLALPDGSYRVSIQPPVVQIDAGPETPPDEGYKEVDNIPVRFHRAETSGLTASVAGDQLEHDFELSS